MTTTLTLQDGRILGTSNGLFDCILELVAGELARNPNNLPGLADWLLTQRCEVQGPGVGYLDLSELSPRAADEFRAAFLAAFRVVDRTTENAQLYDHYLLLRDMFASISKGEPPAALTSPNHRMSPPGGTRRGPGW